MTDLTPLFRQCTEIYEEDLKSHADYPEILARRETQAKRNEESKSKRLVILEDKLIIEAKSMNRAICNIDEFLESVKVEYLLSSERSHKSRNKLNKSNGGIERLDEDSKDKIDSSVGIQLQKLNKMLKNMELMETKRLELQTKQNDVVSASQVLNNFISMGKSEHFKEVTESTNNLFRASVIKYLSINLQNTSKRFLSMKEKRLDRRRELNKFSLNTNLTYQSASAQEVTPTTTIDTEQLIRDDSQPTEAQDSFKQQLSQVQLQELQQENEQLQLEFKSSELVKVGKLENSIMEISQLVNDIGFELNQQNSVIDKLIDNNIDILNDVSKGNLELVKSNERQKNSASRLIKAILISSFLLVLFDWLL